MDQAQHLLANYVMPSHTGLPRDSVEFGLRFWPSTTDDVDPANIANIMSEFINVDPDTGSSIGSYLNGRSYDVANAFVEIAPVVTATGAQGAGFVVPSPISAPGPDTSMYLPLEVAVCLSFTGASSALHTGTAVPLARRRRGRIYTGPFIEGVLANPGTGDLYPEIDPGYVATLTFAAHRLANSAAALDLVWCIYSRTARQITAVLGGWVDNEFDTQRRRQVKADTRTAWETGIVLP